MTDEVIRRGRPTYGVDVGVMLLDADLPRPVGDIANGRTFPFPIHYEVTGGATVPQVVEEAAAGLLDRFVDCGRRLVARGARVLATSCGFLAINQKELVEQVRVPLATSSLMQIPMVLRMLASDQRLCLLSVNASTLDERHFTGAGITSAEMERVLVVGMERSEHFYPVVVGQLGPLDTARARAEVVDVCVETLALHPDVTAFVFECTNLPPYSAAVRAATGLPVWDSTTLVHWLQGGAAGLAST